MSNIAVGLEECIYLGNLNALRDWGHASDYVEMQWLMLQQDTPEDFVIASGKQSSIRDFINISAEKLGIKLKFNGKGIEEYAQVIEVDKSISPQVNEGDIIIKVDQRYFRPAEVETLLGDASYASKKLGGNQKFL